jgi:hypothetical protein
LAALRVVNLTVRFLLELTALGAFGYWAATIEARDAIRIALAIAVPLVVAVFWGLFVSPKARFSTGRIGQVGLGLIVFLAAAVALGVRGHSALGVTFAAIAVVSSALLYALPQ